MMDQVLCVVLNSAGHTYFSGGNNFILLTLMQVKKSPKPPLVAELGLECRQPGSNVPSPASWAHLPRPGHGPFAPAPSTTHPMGPRAEALSLPEKPPDFPPLPCHGTGSSIPSCLGTPLTLSLKCLHTDSIPKI